MKHLITKDMVTLMTKQGWTIKVEVEKLADERGRFLQTGFVEAKRKDIKVNVSNECFILTYIKPAQLDLQLQAITEKLNQGVEISNIEHAFYMSNKNKPIKFKVSFIKV